MCWLLRLRRKAAFWPRCRLWVSCITALTILVCLRSDSFRRAATPATSAYGSDNSAAEEFRQLNRLLSSADEPASCAPLVTLDGRCSCSLHLLNTQDDPEELIQQVDGRSAELSLCLGPLLHRRRCRALLFGDDPELHTTLADLGCRVHVFHPNATLIHQEPTPGLHLHSIMLSAESIPHGRVPELTLSDALSVAGLSPHDEIDYLQLYMGSRWLPVLSQQLGSGGNTMPLLRVRQLAVHIDLYPWRTGGQRDSEEYERDGMSVPQAGQYREVMRRLGEVGFQLVRHRAGRDCQPYPEGCLSYSWYNLYINTRLM